MKITNLSVPGYERVARAEETETGLLAFIAVHSTKLGPAVGGIRMWPYVTEDEARTDVLRLAEGMTYKSAVAETGLGGGKAVIVGDSRTQKCEKLFRAMGRFINDFQGKYYGAEDVGTSVADLEWAALESKWVAGRPRAKGGSGDPSPFTALGVFLGIKACLEDVFGNADFPKRTVTLQGLGSVGRGLAKHLKDAGARIIVADINEERVQAAVKEHGCRSVEPDRIHTIPTDVFAPCALGAGLNDKTIPELKCAIVAGAANNQLHEAHHGEELRRRKIVYAPDFVINAGGIISVSAEFTKGGYDETVATAKVTNIYNAVKRVLALAKEKSIPTSEAALLLARSRLA